MRNYAEELIAELFQAKGYLVARNIWIPFTMKRYRNQNGSDHSYKARSWTDIDVLARNNSELLIIQVKTTINRPALIGRISTYFERIDDFLDRGIALDGLSDISWWTKGLIVKKMVIYESETSPPKYLNQLREKNIIVEPFSKYFIELMNYLNNKNGLKEENPLLRLLHYINYYKNKKHYDFFN